MSVSNTCSITLSFSCFVQIINAIPLLIPGIAMIVSMFFSVRLFSRLKPGLVCDFSDQCSRCDLLYGMSIGVFAFSFIFLLKEMSSYLQTYNNILHINKSSDMNILVSSFMKSAIFIFFSWLCFKGKMCMHSNCLYQNDKKTKIKKQTTNGVFIDGSIILSKSCEPIHSNGFNEIREIDKWKHISKINSHIEAHCQRKTPNNENSIN